MILFLSFIDHIHFLHEQPDVKLLQGSEEDNLIFSHGLPNPVTENADLGEMKSNTQELAKELDVRMPSQYLETTQYNIL